MKHINSNKFMKLIETKDKIIIFGPSGIGGPSVLNELSNPNVLNELYELTHPKKTSYELTQEDKDLLIEIENVLCKRSRQIWGLTHKKKIKGGGDITPYETGYDKLFEYMSLLARIIG